MSKKGICRSLTALMAALCMFMGGCAAAGDLMGDAAFYSSESEESASYAESVSDTPYTVVNDNDPTFSEEEITTVSFEQYADLDELGRCGTAFACIGVDLMPTEERGAIGQVRPSGWHTVKYDCVDGKYLYNRCHLIGYQLSGENANEKNLITGTRYMNTVGMLPFENAVADYVEETGNHVMYRVTPEYDGDNLLANGVQMEALSVEDEGDGICFNVFVYNIQPGIEIDYATGDSREVSDDTVQAAEENDASSGTPKEQKDYIINTSSKKFHLPTCSSVEDIKEENRENYNGYREWLIENGYEPCGRCKP